MESCSSSRRRRRERGADEERGFRRAVVGQLRLLCGLQLTEGAVIIVANASGVTGAAALLTQELGALGFHLGNPTNAAGIEEKLDVSKVYYMPAGADVATSVGRVMGNILVTRMPVPVWITGGPARLGDATVVVMLGKDLAGNKPIVRT